MAFIETKKVTVINNEIVKETEVNCINFDLYDEIIKIGVNYTINGYNFCLGEILSDTISILRHKLEGTKFISELEPNSKLCCKNLDLSEDIFLNTIGIDNPVIILSEKDIKRAKHTVKQYEYLISILELMLAGSDEIDKPKYDLLP